MRPILFILSLGLALGFSGLVFSASPGGDREALKAIRSYDGNFLVTASDHLTCGWAARIAELTREKVFRLLGYEKQWNRAASILLLSRERKTDAGDLKLWTVTITKGSLRLVSADLYPNKMADMLVLQVVHLCLADMAGITLPETGAQNARALPPWLWCGVAENLSGENLVDLRSYVAKLVNRGASLPIEQLLQTQEIPVNEARRELFFRQSGSIIDFLLHRENGASLLTEAISRLGEQDDISRSLLLAFSRDFNTLAQLEEQWKDFAVQQVEHTIASPKMLVSETKQALDNVLTIKIPAIDRRTLEERIITTDLTGLFRHRNRRLVQQIASEKASQVFSLSLRAKPEYGPVLQEYLQALTAIAQNDRAEFKRHFALAERMRKKLETSPVFNEMIEDGDTDNE